MSKTPNTSSSEHMGLLGLGGISFPPDLQATTAEAVSTLRLKVRLCASTSWETASSPQNAKPFFSTQVSCDPSNGKIRKNSQTPHFNRLSLQQPEPPLRQYRRRSRTRSNRRSQLELHRLAESRGALTIAGGCVRMPSYTRATGHAFALASLTTFSLHRLPSGIYSFGAFTVGTWMLPLLLWRQRMMLLLQCQQRIRTSMKLSLRDPTNPRAMAEQEAVPRQGRRSEAFRSLAGTWHRGVLESQAQLLAKTRKRSIHCAAVRHN